MAKELCNLDLLGVILFLLEGNLFRKIEEMEWL